MISILIATYGSSEWKGLARERAYPSARDQGAHEVIVHHEPRGDVASSRNAAAGKATGEWLCFLDGDDELAPFYIQHMERAATNSKGQLLLLAPRVCQVVKGRMKPPRFYKPTSFETGNWVVIGTVVRKDLFTQVGGFHLFAHGLEDWNLWARCTRAGAIVRKVPSAIYVAHYNDESAHHQLARDREAYMTQYEAARADAWS